MEENCIFCEIKSGGIDGEILYQNSECFVIKDIAPKAPIHLLIIPNRHFTKLSGLKNKDNQMVGAMYQAAKEMAHRQQVNDKGYRLIINQGEDAGQAVDHLHLHLLAGKKLSLMG